MKRKKLYRIKIQNLAFETIIGILPFERENPQKIIINALLDYHFENNAFINYADVCKLIETNLQEQRYHLIEDALKNLTSILKKEYNQISSIQIEIIKPNILENANVGVEYFEKY